MTVRAGARRVRSGCPAFAVGSVLLLILTAGAGCGDVDAGAGGAAFDVMERSITELAAALDAGEVTSRELVAGYLARIDAYDQRGPLLNAMVVLNPNAADEADRLDAERAAGQVRGPLHGIPVVVKDNYDTGDMPTSAGAIALATSVPPDDSTQVRRLREAGAIVLGKTNMHELARGITTVSSLTGQTRNPYDPDPQPRRVERRHRRRRRRQLRRRGHGERYLRVDPHPVGPPRPGGAAGDAGARERRRHRAPLDHPGHRRPPRALGGGPRDHARRHRGASTPPTR